MTLDPQQLLADADAQRLIIRATLIPTDGRDRFQPAGFPEVGHVIFDAPRKNGEVVKVCIVDSPSSMANHLEAVCLRGEHDPEPVEELNGLPYVRCVTDGSTGKKDRVVVTTLTEGHRLASTYFVGQQKANAGGTKKRKTSKTKALTDAKPEAGTGVGRRLKDDGLLEPKTFGEELREACGILDLGKRSMALPGAWWSVFKTIFKYDPNSLVHGVLFPQWNVKISRVLTAHHEAIGAARVPSAGVKFDRLKKAVSGQPIFAVDEETAEEIRATFVVDLALVRSFGREKNGLNDKQKNFLVAFALWKIGRLLRGPFRYRTGCDLKAESAAVELVRSKKAPSAPGTESSNPAAAAETGEQTKGPADTIQQLLAVEIKTAIAEAAFEPKTLTDVYWPEKELFKAGEEQQEEASPDEEENEDTADEDDAEG